MGNNEESNMFKPVFMTKQQREQLKLEKKKQEDEKMHQQSEQARINNKNFLKKVNEKSSEKNEKKNDESKVIDEQKKSTVIVEKYLGASKNFKRKRSDKRFNFDWEVTDDTANGANEYNKLYLDKHEVKFFGRGRLAGFDNTAEEAISTEHWSKKSLSQMTDRDWRIFKEDFNISTKGGKVVNPIRYWSESKLPEEILDAVEALNYKELTPIQKMAIPLGLQNRDIIGIAETGSGKTAAFVIPLLVWIMNLPKVNPALDETQSPYAIILAPTRELAQQIANETEKFAAPLLIRTVSLVGGQSKEQQANYLRFGCEIIIATPGRLLDVLDSRIVVLSQCSYVVLDEADRMIDLGFEESLTKILNYLPVSNNKKNDDVNNFVRDDEIVVDEKSGEAHFKYNFNKVVRYRQTSMYTATMPSSVEKLARKYMFQPVTIYIGEAGKPVDRIEQKVLIIKEIQKKTKLYELLHSGEFVMSDNDNGSRTKKVIVFVQQKHNVDSVSRYLEQKGLRTTTLHGGKSQDARERAIQEVRSSQRNILIATDVASRGIDIKDVEYVVNFDAPKSIEDYIHRIGRTGRAGKTGTAITFLTQEDAHLFYDLRMLLLNSPVSKCPDELLNHPDAQHRPGTVVEKKRKDQILYKA